MNKKLSMEELNRLTVSEFQGQSKMPLVLVLDNIRSMNNVGSAFRTADSFNIEKIYLGGITATPPNREITKTALGADDSVEWTHKPEVIDIINDLKKDGYIICVIEQVENSTKLNEFQPVTDKKYAFVYGNEVFGVNDEIIKLANYCLEIPQFGTKHSLNVSVSIGITCWDFLCKTFLK